jgi:beta-glucuronidase
MIKEFLCLSIVAALFSSAGNSRTHREQQLLSGNWLFALDSAGKGEQNKWPEKGIPISSCRMVRVPHAWNADTSLENYVGKAWYQRDFDIPAALVNRIVRLQFDAVFHDATIYVNGKKAAVHIGSGYTRFFVDASPFLHQGVNRLCVLVDNSFSQNNIPFMHSFDWPNDGGIIRNVYLVSSEHQAIQSIHVTATPEGSSGNADICITLLDLSFAGLSTVAFEATVVEENQPTTNTVFSGKLKARHVHGSFIAHLSLDNIKSWHFDHPSLYRITIALNVNGQETDTLSEVFGFRSIKVEHNRFVLNGEAMRLMGVEWMPGSTLEHGMAETTTDLERNLLMLKNVNCIFTRFHWQQDDYVFDWCDRHGILVQEEIPYWGSVTVLNDTLLQLGYKQLIEMIDAHYNHPSIIAWGIGNELNSRDTANISSIKKLYRCAKERDSSRLVDYVSNMLGVHRFDNNKLPDDASAIGDMLMFNEYYSTWFDQSIDVVPYHLQKICEDYPGKPLVISEWGLCEPVFKGGDIRRCREMVKQIAMFAAQPNLTGAIYFCLNDYRTHMGEDHTYRYPQRVHGVCDIHLNPKLSYDTLKQLSAPIVIKEIKRRAKGITITLVGSTGIPSYTVREYAVQAGKTRAVIDKLEPGEELKVEVEKQAEELIIRRPTGFEVMRVKL